MNKEDSKLGHLYMKQGEYQAEKWMKYTGKDLKDVDMQEFYN